MCFSVLDLLNFNQSYFSYGESVFNKKGWALHFNNNRYCLITKNGFLNNIDDNYTNFSNWKLTDKIPLDSTDVIKLKAIKQVYSRSMINNKLRVK